MKYAYWLCLLFLMSLSAVSFAGDIQITCEPALRVYLDDEFMGTSSSKEDGLFLLDIPKGTHTIRVEKDGFLPQSFQVDSLDLPIEVKVEEFSPELPREQETEPAADKVTQLVGSLMVISAPQNCVVEIDGKSETKNSPQLSIGGLAAGEHTISFSKSGYDRISGVVAVKPGVEITVRGNLKSGKVEIMHEGEGSLRVISDPVRCTVRFLGMTKETHTRLNLSHIPAGEHPIKVSWNHFELATKVTIMDGQRTILHVSFMEGDEPFVVSYKPEKKR